MQYTETQLSKLIEDVEREFTSHLAKAEEDSELEVLAKAEGSEKKKEAKPDEKAPEAPEAPEAEAKPEGEAPSQEAAPEGEAPTAAPAALAPPGQEGGGEGGSGYDAEDMAHMEKMYASMSKEELKAHHDCIAKLASSEAAAPGGPAPAPGAAPAAPALSKSEIGDENPKLNSKPTDKGEPMFPDKKNGGIEDCQPCNALGPKSAASAANGAKLNKAEHDRRNGGKIDGEAVGKTPGAKSPASNANGDKLNKSEDSEVQLLKSELSEANTKFDKLQKNFEAVSAFLTKLVDKKVAPAAKAITSLDVIAKSEGLGEDEKVLTKSEIDSILNKKSSDPTLQKSDRDAINTYYLGDKDIKGISHLLK